MVGQGTVSMYCAELETIVWSAALTSTFTLCGCPNRGALVPTISGCVIRDRGLTRMVSAEQDFVRLDLHCTFSDIGFEAMDSDDAC